MSSALPFFLFSLAVFFAGRAIAWQIKKYYIFPTITIAKEKRAMVPEEPQQQKEVFAFDFGIGNFWSYSIKLVSYLFLIFCFLVLSGVLIGYFGPF